MFETPILFITFNRPDPTRKVFNVLRKIKPKFLFFASDGPRNDKPTDVEKCKQVRGIINEIDWDCKVQTLFHVINQGCGKGPAEAISWFFNNVDEGIILEDDCVPHIDFFFFCEELLTKYRDNSLVLSIAGSNFQDGKKRGDASYYFSVHNRIWGWASWKRTWINYDYFLNNISEKEFLSIVSLLFRRKSERIYWLNIFKYSKANQTDNSAWDFQFMFLQWKLGGLTLTPNSNLISNIGYGDDATHTAWGINNPNLNRPTQAIFPLIHPSKVEQNRSADEYYFSKFIRPKSSIIFRLVHKLRKFWIH